MKGVGVVTALKAEARTLGPVVRRPDGWSSLSDGALLAVSGMGGPLAGIASLALVEAGASALMSFGLAGGLDPNLGAGSVVLPCEVVSHDGTCYLTAGVWREQLRPAIAQHRPVAGGKLLSSQAAIGTLADKARAFRETGALAVDMESAAIAEVAAAHGLPFVAVRVIVDTAVDVLPRAVVAASVKGRVNLGRLIVGIAAAPLELLALFRLAQRYRVARRSLLTVAAVRGAAGVSVAGGVRP